MLLVPALGALFLSVFRSVLSSRVSSISSVLIASVVLGLGVGILVLFDGHHNPESGFLHDAFVPGALAVDGVALSLVLLSAFLFLLCAILNVFDGALCSERSFFPLFLLLESLVIGVFSAYDPVIFYVFFEASLIPMFFIIGFWGHGDRVGTAFKFLIYTAVGSLLFLSTLVYTNVASGTAFKFGDLGLTLPSSFLDSWQVWIWIACFCAFAVKLPMVPFHTWLPSAHVQAPTTGSVLLAGLLIKMGGYGFLRFCIHGLPGVSAQFAKFVLLLSAISLVYSSLVAFVQKNMKTLVAYSSVAHMSLVTAGMFSLNENGILGAIFQMLSHGLISGALFLCVGMIYDRTGTLEMSRCGGLASSMPRLAVMMIFFSMASVGLPGTSGFIGEFLSMLGIFETFKSLVLCFAVGMVLSAIYMLRLCKEVIWGSQGSVVPRSDINVREFTVLLVLAAVVLFLGMAPSSLIAFLKPGVSKVLLPMQEFQLFRR